MDKDIITTDKQQQMNLLPYSQTIFFLNKYATFFYYLQACIDGQHCYKTQIKPKSVKFFSVDLFLTKTTNMKGINNFQDVNVQVRLWHCSRLQLLSLLSSFLSYQNIKKMQINPQEHFSFIFNDFVFIELSIRLLQKIFIQKDFSSHCQYSDYHQLF